MPAFPKFFDAVTGGLFLPDASAQMPDGTLAQATNCDITHSGTVKQRYGAGFNGTALTGCQYSFVHNATIPQFNVLKADGSGQTFGVGYTRPTTEATISGGPTGATGSVQMLRSALSTANPNTYVSSPTNVLTRWDGSAFTTVANSPKCRYVAQAGWAERLIYGGFDAGATNGPNGSPVDQSIVGCSNPSQPEIYTTADTTSISPGDGEPIMGIVTWNSQTFVFKQTSFFVFYGEDDSGGSVELLFNQRKGNGCTVQGAIAVSPVGVFFQSADGIYLTTGATAQNVSESISGLFTGDLPSWTTYERILPSPATATTKMVATADALYCAVSNVSIGGNITSVILKYDWSMKAWTYYLFNCAALAAMPWTNIATPLLLSVAYDGSYYRAAVFHPLVRTDNGNWFPVKFQFGWFVPMWWQGRRQFPAERAAFLRLEGYGAGIYDVGASADYQSATGVTKTMDFGDAAAFSDVWPGYDSWGDGSDLTDEWGNGSQPNDVWGFAGTNEIWGNGSDTTDVWGNGFGATTDLLRLQPPVHKYLYNLSARGNYLSLTFSKTAASTYCYLSTLRSTLDGYL